MRESREDERGARICASRAIPAQAKIGLGQELRVVRISAICPQVFVVVPLLDASVIPVRGTLREARRLKLPAGLSSHLNVLAPRLLLRFGLRFSG